jgi:general secretion pathway protein I
MKRTGFSLLEVIIALAILVLSLMAIFDLNAGAVRSHVYTKKLTIATLLARSKMTDLEQELYDKGFQNDDDEQSGDFSDEGWGSFKWRAKIIAPKTEGLSPQQLIGALFNFPMGDGKEGGDDPLGGLGALFGGGGKDAAAAAAGGAGGAGALAALGPAAGLAQGQFTQMIDQLTKAVREVHLTVSWKDGKQTESIDLVTHVVSLGQGSDRNGGAMAAAMAGVTTTTGQVDLVNQNTGAPVPNPQQGPNGPIDPADGAPAIARAAYLAMHPELNNQVLGGGTRNILGGIPSLGGGAFPGRGKPARVTGE